MLVEAEDRHGGIEARIGRDRDDGRVGRLKMRKLNIQESGLGANVFGACVRLSLSNRQGAQ